MTPRVLAIMGSGETAPSMVSTHRSLVARLQKPVRATVIDTPYGFQENATELAERATAYFATSVEIDVTIAGLLRLKGDSLDPVAIERGLRHVADADWVFAGPGSPTYALRQWSGTPLHSILTEKLRTGGVVTFASAAALTLGSHTVPVYEIYKVGEDTRWEQGLDLLGDIGIHAAVVPHFDNAEGGHHDTRFCYLGETRLARMEALLPDGHFVLGIDEHTALVLDLDADTATVTGRGGVTIRVRGASTVHPSGSSFPLETLRSPGSTAAVAGSGHVGTFPSVKHSADPDPHAASAGTRSSDGTDQSAHLKAFREAMANRDADSAGRAALAMEQEVADEGTGGAVQQMRGELRSMISALGDAAVSGVQDPRRVVGPFVEAMLRVRAVVRAEKRYDLSDVIRDSFEELGVEVRDTKDGVTWDLRA